MIGNNNEINLEKTVFTFILVMGLKYIYAGYSKCATKTMAEAFRVLGFIVHDFEETILDDMDLWLKFYDEETSDSERKRENAYRVNPWTIADTEDLHNFG